jgi:acetolactate synthase-1/2/3 large subunit
MEASHDVDAFTYPGRQSENHFLFLVGLLGFGLPSANAAKLAHPDRPVFCLTGDGAFGMTIQELETAVRYGLKVIVIVFNDSYWGMYKPFGDILDNPGFGTRLTTVDFAKGKGLAVMQKM